MSKVVETFLLFFNSINECSNILQNFYLTFGYFTELHNDFKTCTDKWHNQELITPSTDLLKYIVVVFFIEFVLSFTCYHSK